MVKSTHPNDVKPPVWAPKAPYWVATLVAALATLQAAESAGRGGALHIAATVSWGAITALLAVAWMRTWRAGR